jgi:hypothetical protein
MSMANTRLRRCIQLMGAGGLSVLTMLRDRRGTMRLRCLKLGAKTPWNRMRLNLGRGTRGQQCVQKHLWKSSQGAIGSRTCRFSRLEYFQISQERCLILLIRR